MSKKLNYWMQLDIEYDCEEYDDIQYGGIGSITLETDEDEFQLDFDNNYVMHSKKEGNILTVSMEKPNDDFEDSKRITKEDFGKIIGIGAVYIYRPDSSEEDCPEPIAITGARIYLNGKEIALSKEACDRADIDFCE